TLATLERLVDPQRPLPDAVARLTGITQADLKGAATAESAVRELIHFIGGRQPVGHGARLDMEFLTASGLWDAQSDILDTLDVARILMPAAASHSLPLLPTALRFSQPRPPPALHAAPRRPARNRRHACPRRRTGRDAAWLRAPRAPATDGACRRADPGAQRHAAGRGRHRDGQEHRVPRAVARSRSPPEGTRGGLDAHSHAAGAADEQGPSGP